MTVKFLQGFYLDNAETARRDIQKTFVTLANLYTQIDEYVQKIQYWGVQIYQFYKHSDTNLRFYLIL